jgi:hypothetical protein
MREAIQMSWSGKWVGKAPERVSMRSEETESIGGELTNYKDFGQAEEHTE